MQERLQYWFGPLNAQQRQRVLRWAHTLSEQNSRWLRNREQWQTMLLAAVEQRHGADFDKRIARLLQDREALLNEDDRAALQRAEQAGLELVADLHRLADDGHRAHLSGRLTQLQSDFGSLKCLAGRLTTGPQRPVEVSRRRASRCAGSSRSSNHCGLPATSAASGTPSR